MSFQQPVLTIALHHQAAFFLATLSCMSTPCRLHGGNWETIQPQRLTESKLEQIDQNWFLPEASGSKAGNEMKQVPLPLSKIKLRYIVGLSKKLFIAVPNSIEVWSCSAVKFAPNFSFPGPQRSLQQRCNCNCCESSKACREEQGEATFEFSGAQETRQPSNYIELQQPKGLQMHQ